MKAAIFVQPGRIVLDDKPIPRVGPRDALLRVTTTTICGTDVHILKGEYPVAPGLTVGHEPVGVIEELGSAVSGYEIGQRVIAGAITPCGQCHACLGGNQAQCGGKRLLGTHVHDQAMFADSLINFFGAPTSLARQFQAEDRRSFLVHFLHAAEVGRRKRHSAQEITDPLFFGFLTQSGTKSPLIADRGGTT